jgi:lipid A 3-O-deacylase
MPRSILAILGLLALLPSAQAAEIRLGVLAHDVGVFGGEHEEGHDVMAEFLFDSPDVLAPIWAPRPHVGVAVNTVGDTSQAYAGLTWRWDATDWLFLDFSLGGSIHNGELETDRQDKVNLGSRVLFRESIGVGVRLNESHTVSVVLAHISNANLAEHNEGLDTFGIHWGWRF